MKKAKLNLDKKTVAKLSEENLENVQGGKKTGWILCCTKIVVEPEQPTEVEEAAADIDIVISCKG